MAKILDIRSFDFVNILGENFELDEVTPVFEMETRLNAAGEIIKDRNGNERNFPTDKIIGYNYSVTIMKPPYKKKSIQVKVLDTEEKVTNAFIMLEDSVQCMFTNLQVSMINNSSIYYRAEGITILQQEPEQKKK